ncbi:LOW QUALITY PROTEIN: GATA zinc finger domain-containing protein 7-like [Osmia bicornis bicornis]|uniref:LOW QUALITY PROTEIN: GATA zinc finger domain-containing protein 7-like n=1 Tax=Osmia bicornis bicornis TaxID=1437191 RepID=UPI001EAEBBFB|nr:LOW QUALITY PROTEIN: GATA zinc finger domain-containing protein 7-like [Osmia bicornis bicornis]
MSGQSGGHRLRLSKLNDQLTCKLCGGYFIDATTIIECLHSFCRSCIVKYLENNKYCPICEVQVHKSKPLLNIRPDYTLQDIVYKLVPGCYQNEMRCRREFYSKHPEACTQATSPEARGEPTESHIYSPDESLSLSLEYFSPSKDVKGVPVKPLLRRYLRCPAAVTIFHLQKLIRAKYGLTDAHRVDIMYKEEPLSNSYTLMDVMYIYHWRRKVPLHLSYRIFESSPKRIKLSEDNVNYKTSLLHAGIDSIDSKDEHSLKREWKEVQLKISETGIMSITDISNQQFQKSAALENSIASKVETINTSITEDNNSGNNLFEITKKNEHSSDKQIMDDCDISSKLHELDDKKNVNQTEGKKISTEETGIMVNCKNEEEPKSHSDSTNADDKVTSQLKETSQCVDNSETRNNIENEDQKDSSRNNNNIIIEENKLETSKQNSKNEVKFVNTGSKINALSVKLQFQPKIEQFNTNNNVSSKKTVKDKKLAAQSSKKADAKTIESTKSTEAKNSVDASKAQVTTNNCGVAINKSIVPYSTKTTPQKGTSESQESRDFDLSMHLTSTSVCSEANETDSNIRKAQQIDQDKKENSSQKTNGQTNTVSQKSLYMQIESLTNENFASSNVSTSMSVTVGNGISSASTSTINQSMCTFPYMVQDLVNSTMLKNSLKNLTSPGQKLSVSTSSENEIVTCTIANNNVTFNMPSANVSSSSKNNYSNSVMTASKESALKGNLEITGTYSVPPCPDAIPISLMKPTVRKNELITKGLNLNEICAKIGASGSKIDDICAKIGENSKEKNKIEVRSKSEIPDLLKIGRKNSSQSVMIDSSGKQHPNISSVSVYAPNSNPVTVESKNVYVNVKDSLRATSLVSSSPTVTSHSLQKVPSSVSKKLSQAVGYKTLRDPPRCWNPTLSKNNYVAVKNQNKEAQNQLHQTALFERSKTIQSKPAKIFKMRNMPRYLGNPASGVKPMYGISNECKDKEQSAITPTTTTSASNASKNGNLSMMKIDPKTLSPIVSTVNSPIVSPPPYSPSARSYPNPPFSRDICRSTGSPISPKNSPVNMLSTSPFIPSPTPNINPRLIYPHFPPPFPDASRFPNPLIRSPIGIPSPSAFHSSLPPSINKLYQRSNYIPQTTGFSPVSQPPTVQRIPPSTYSSPKSPKTTSLTAMSPTSYGLVKPETQTVATSLETNNLILPKSTSQEDVSAFNLSKTGSFCNAETVKTSTEVVRNNSKSTTLCSISNVGQGKRSPTVQVTSKTKLVDACSPCTVVQEQNKEQPDKEIAKCKEDSSYTCKEQNLEKKQSDENSDSVNNKKKEKLVFQINGDLSNEGKQDASVEKLTEQQKEQNDKKIVPTSDKTTAKQQIDESKSEECERNEEQGKKSESQVNKMET